MSEEIMAADSLIRENARLLAELAQFRRVLDAVKHFWLNDPLAFGDDATPTTLAGRFGAIGQLCCDTLELVPTGAPLLAELEAARAVVAAVRGARATLQDAWPETRDLRQALAQYDRATSAPISNPGYAPTPDSPF